MSTYQSGDRVYWHDSQNQSSRGPATVLSQSGSGLKIRLDNGVERGVAVSEVYRLVGQAAIPAPMAATSAPVEPVKYRFRVKVQRTRYETYEVIAEDQDQAEVMVEEKARAGEAPIEIEAPEDQSIESEETHAFYENEWIDPDDIPDPEYQNDDQPAW